MNYKNLAILFVILSMIIWGANVTIMKVALLYVPPFSMGFLRFFAASLLFLPFLFKKINLRDITPSVLITGLIGITLTLSLFFIGIRLTTALNAGIIVAFSPLLTLIAAHFLLKEEAKKNLLLGGALGLVGIGVIIGKDILTNGFTLSPIGDFLIFLSVISSVYYAISSKKIMKKHPPLLTTFYVLFIGSIGFFPGFIWEWTKNPTWINNLPAEAIFGILFAIVFSSFAAHTMWNWSLSKMEATKLGVFHYIEPIATTTTAVLFLSEKITLPFVMGAFFIFSGLLVAEVHRHHHPPHHR